MYLFSEHDIGNKPAVTCIFPNGYSLSIRSHKGIRKCLFIPAALDMFGTQGKKGIIALQPDRPY